MEQRKLTPLLPADVKATIPPLYSQDNVADPVVLVHYFNPTGAGDWYVTEGGMVDGDFIFFGLVNLLDTELGYFSLNELQSVRLRFGLRIERDLYWNPKPLSEVKKGLN